jgi:hypothetical protein
LKNLIVVLILYLFLCCYVRHTCDSICRIVLSTCIYHSWLYVRELYALIAYMKDRSSTYSERHTKNRSSTCILGSSHTEQFIYMYTRSVTYRTVHLHVYSERHIQNSSSTCLLGASHTEQFIYMSTRSVTYRTVLLHVYSERHIQNSSSTCLLGASHTEQLIYILVASYNILLLIRLNCTVHPFLYIFREKSDKDPSHKRVYSTVSVY